MDKSCVQSLQGFVERRIARGLSQSKLMQQRWVEVQVGNKVTVATTRVELECEKDKESAKRKLDRSTKLGGLVRDGSAKAHKFIK